MITNVAYRAIHYILNVDKFRTVYNGQLKAYIVGDIMLTKPILHNCYL